MKIKIFAVTLPLSILGFLACDKAAQGSATPAAQAAPEAPAVAMTARELTAIYKQNEVAADDKFKGKTVEVAGIIGEIGKNAFDQMFVSIKTDLESMDLLASFEDAQKASLAALKAGQPVKIKGRVDGFIMGGVTLKECVIVK